MQDKEMEEKKAGEKETEGKGLKEKEAGEKELEKSDGRKKANGKMAVLAVVLVAMLAVFLVIFNVFREKPVEGSKTVTLEVLNQENQTSEYQVRTDAEFLRQAMEEAEGFTFDGGDGAVYTINGETHDWNVDGSYWAIYVNGEYGQYGIDEQPIKDGDVYRFEYTPPYSGE